MRIADVLRTKGTDVHTVTPLMLVSELLELLTARNIGAVVVLDGGGVAGVVSERDVVRGLASRGNTTLQQPVGAIMTTDVVSCGPEDTVDGVMALMTERRFRHVPVCVDGQLSGIVSIGDMVSARMRELEAEREQLHSYITSG